MREIRIEAPEAREVSPGRRSSQQRVLSLPAVAVFLFAGLVFFARLGDPPLIDPDEGRNATIAAEMWDSGAWLVPTLNGLPYLDKPAPYFKIVGLALAAFGRNEAAARLPSALGGAVLVTLLFVFSRRAYGDRTAALAVIVVASTPLVAGFARLVIFDMPLAVFTSSAILAGYLAEERTGTARRGWYLVGAAALAAATLVKGPVGFLVPGLVLVVFHTVERRPTAIARLVGPLNLLLFFALVLPWFLGVLRREPDFFYYGLIQESLQRYLTPELRRAEPVYYYAPVLLVVCYPWSALLPAGVASAWRARARLLRADRLFIVWASVVLLFFSTSQSKRPGYILTGVIALGVLTGRLLDRALADPTSATARLVLRATFALALMSAAAGAVLTLTVIEPGRLEDVLHFHSDEFDRLEPALPLLALSLFSVASVALAARLRRDLRLTLAALLLPPLLLLTTGFGAAVRYAEASSSRPLARALESLPQQTAVACLECFPVGLPFYLGRTVTYITEHGRALTSNYVRFRLRKAGDWPEALVYLDHRDQWLASQVGPVYLMAREPARALLEEIAASRGATVTEFHPGWWGALLRAPATR